MATWHDIWEEPKNIFGRYDRWRRKNLDDTRAGYLLTQPNRITPSTFKEAIYRNENLRNSLADVIRNVGLSGRELMTSTGGKSPRLIPITDPRELSDRIVELIDPNNTKIPDVAKVKFNDEINRIKGEWENHDFHARANRRWENGKKIPFSNLRYNAELAKQNLAKLGKGLKLGSYLDLALLANDLHNADDQQDAFEDFIGYRKDDPSDTNKYFHLGDHIVNAGVGAGIGALASGLTGTGLLSGAAAGALGAVAPTAALAGGYYLGSKLDKATGASDKIAKFLRNHFYDMDEEKAKLAKAEEDAKNDPEVMKAWEYLHARDALMKEKGISKQEANRILDADKQRKIVKDYAQKFMNEFIGIDPSNATDDSDVADGFDTVVDNDKQMEAAKGLYTAKPRVDFLSQLADLYK